MDTIGGGSCVRTQYLIDYYKYYNWFEWFDD